MLRTLVNNNPMSPNFNRQQDNTTNNYTVVDVKFESSLNSMDPNSHHHLISDPGHLSHMDYQQTFDDSSNGALHTPNSSPPSSDLGCHSGGKKRKQNIPKKLSVDEEDNPIPPEERQDMVVKTEQMDFSLHNYDDIVAHDQERKEGLWIQTGRESLGTPNIQMDPARLEAQRINSKQREDCPICGDKANGLHYGVYTCEGCKNFFKRSVVVTQRKPYVCTLGNACDVRIVIDMAGLKRKGARCQACRYTACLNAGMYHSGYPRTRGGRSSKGVARQGGTDWTDMISGFLPPQQETRRITGEQVDINASQGLPVHDNFASYGIEAKRICTENTTDSTRVEDPNGNDDTTTTLQECEEMVASVWNDQLERERSKNRDITNRLQEKDIQLKLSEKQVETMKCHMLKTQKLSEMQAEEIKRLKIEIDRLSVFRSTSQYRNEHGSKDHIPNGAQEEDLTPSDIMSVGYHR